MLIKDRPQFLAAVLVNIRSSGTLHLIGGSLVTAMQMKGIDPSEGTSTPKSIYFLILFYNKTAGITVHLNIGKYLPLDMEQKTRRLQNC